jgi:hypothetical protein
MKLLRYSAVTDCALNLYFTFKIERLLNIECFSKVLHKTFRHIFDGLESQYAKELAVIREQYPSERVQFTDSPLIIHWPDAMQMLKVCYL